MASKSCNLVWQNTSDATQRDKKKIRTSEHAGLISDILQRSSDLEGETLVIKLPASVIEDSELLKGAVNNIALLKSTGANIIVVHDHTNLVSQTLELFGIKKEYEISAVATDQKTARIAEMVVSGYINKNIVSKLCAAGCNAIGISGKDCNFIEAKKQIRKVSSINEKVLEFGFIGEPATINPEILMKLADDDFVIVISPVAFGENGETYLLDSNMTVAIVSSITVAKHLILLTEGDSEIADAGSYRLTELKAMYNGYNIDDCKRKYMEATISALENNTSSVHITMANSGDAILLSVFSEKCSVRVERG